VAKKVRGQPCWLIDWQRFFKGGLVAVGSEVWRRNARFHIIFPAAEQRIGEIDILGRRRAASSVRNGSIIHHENVLTRGSERDRGD